jgi:hypothetical protein
MSVLITTQGFEQAAYARIDCLGRRATQIENGAWSKLRIGCLWEMGDSAGTVANGHLRMGLIKGPTLPVAAPTSGSYLGVTHAAVLDMTGAGGFFRAPAAGSASFCYQLNTCTIATCIGGLIGGSTAVMTAQTINIAAGTAGTARSLFFLDITKGSPNYTFDLFRKNNTTFTDISKIAFQAFMVQAVPVVPNHSSAGATGATHAFDEAANGVFDTAYIEWGWSNPSLRLADFAVYRLA